MKIIFNDPSNYKDRQKIKKLSLSEENEVIEILNDALHFHTDKEKQKVQKLIYHYENLCHFASINSNDWLKYCK